MSVKRANARRLFRALEGPLAAWRSDEGFCFYFMRKPPDVRLRLFASAEAHRDLGRLLDHLVAEHVLVNWFSSVYEPETERFGGPATMQAIHRWFDVDTSQWMRLDRERDVCGEDAGLLRPHEICAAVASDLVLRTVDGPAEAWDVWTAYAAGLGERRERAADLLPTLPDLGALTERATTEEKAAIDTYAAANVELSRSIKQAWASGELTRGMRAVIGTVVLFHFHRHGLAPEMHDRIASSLAHLLTPHPR